jgi:transcriptional regulator with XRE-family HTH domain
MKISKAITEARTRAALSQVELAKRAGVGIKTIGNIERGAGTPSGATLTKVARALDFLTIEELFATIADQAGKLQGPPRGLLPVLGSVRAGFAWDFDPSGDPSVGENGVGVDYLKRSLVGVDDPEAFAAVVDGDSMMPDLAPQETAICSPARAAAGLNNGAIYAIRLGDAHQHATMIRRLNWIAGAEEARLVPSNPRHKTIAVALADIDRIAEVVATIRRLA